VGGHPHLSQKYAKQDFNFKRHFIYNKLEAILFEEMRRIGLLREIVK
jgi:hypothetical protein